ncbi:nuclear transport factor 2 family protein [Haloechinothrix sp. YIM 98757]|uniref:Nuclear transport factor 2 family protein n=1 Tax=Haloechinothrix aidingensis TaxID=2752311 RepID=A0A838ACK3_9PSEU|nr:nuclear transport factor 2 family protein [Haloechinothrix aidingensis]MBA0126953.1 nuclear transport factor 2 family protein [Haloechinothrix aidingensis]
MTRREGAALDRRTVIALLGAVLAVAVACSVWFGLRAHELRGGSGDNLAFADSEATSEVVESVSATLRAVFSYDHTNLERTERAVEVGLTGEAAAAHRDRFDAAARRATEEELVRTSTIRSIGVRELDGETATLLVFLDQQTRSAEGGAPESRTATLDVTAEMVDGEWRVSAIDVL